MIRVRDDDILVHSSSYEDELGRVKQVHEWICEVPDQMIHIPTILVTEIQDFPECIEWLKQETQEGRVIPEIHGLSHKDYGGLSSKEVILELEECIEWIYNTLGHRPTRFYTPWGAGADERGSHLKEDAASLQLELVTCERITKMTGRNGVIRRMMEGTDNSFLDDHEIFTHWWQGGSRLKRIVEVLKHGSWEEAKRFNKKLFAE